MKPVRCSIPRYLAWNATPTPTISILTNVHFLEGLVQTCVLNRWLVYQKQNHNLETFLQTIYELRNSTGSQFFSQHDSEKCLWENEMGKQYFHSKNHILQIRNVVRPPLTITLFALVKDTSVLQSIWYLLNLFKLRVIKAIRLIPGVLDTGEPSETVYLWIFSDLF